MADFRVLLLEDDPQLRAVLFDALTDEGFTVLACASFDDLLQRARSGEGDLAVADYWGSGYASLSSPDQRQVQALATVVPLVMVTGRAWVSDTPLHDLGVAAVLRKPFDLDELLTSLRAILERRDCRAS